MLNVGLSTDEGLCRCKMFLLGVHIIVNGFSEVIIELDFNRKSRVMRQSLFQENISRSQFRIPQCSCVLIQIWIKVCSGNHLAFLITWLDMLSMLRWYKKTFMKFNDKNVDIHPRNNTVCIQVDIGHNVAQYDKTRSLWAFVQCNVQPICLCTALETSKVNRECRPVVVYYIDKQDWLNPWQAPTKFVPKIVLLT